MLHQVGVSFDLVGSSEYLCPAGGKFCKHSAEFVVCAGNKISRFRVHQTHDEIQ